MYTSCLIFSKLVPKYSNFSVIHFAGVPLDSNISGIGHLITIFLKLIFMLHLPLKYPKLDFRCSSFLL